MTDVAAPARAAYDQAYRVLLERHRKYGPLNISNSPGGPLNGIRVRMFDKLARVSNYVDGNATADFADDSLEDAFIDLANYAVIALLVLRGQWPGQAQAVHEDPAPELPTDDGWVWAPGGLSARRGGSGINPAPSNVCPCGTRYGGGGAGVTADTDPDPTPVVQPAPPASPTPPEDPNNGWSWVRDKDGDDATAVAAYAAMVRAG